MGAHRAALIEGVYNDVWHTELPWLKGCIMTFEAVYNDACILLFMQIEGVYNDATKQESRIGKRVEIERGPQVSMSYLNPNRTSKPW